MSLQSLRGQNCVSARTGESSSAHSHVFAPQAEDHILRARDASVLLSQARAKTPTLVSTRSSLRRRDELLQRHRRCMYNFCRCLSACPADTQCQSKQAMEHINASHHELARHAQRRDAHVSMYDVKPKKPTECACLVAVRLFFLSFVKCLTCMPPRDAVTIRKDLVRPL